MSQTPLALFQRCRKDCPPSECVRSHRWGYLVEVVGPDGARRQRMKGGFVSGKEAAEARAEVLREHREGTLPTDDKATVATWLRQWLITQEDVRGLRDGTIVDYQRHIEQYWIPRIGAVKLTDLRPDHVTDTLAKIKKERDKLIREANELNARYAAEAAVADEARKAAGRKRPVKPKRVPVPRPFGPATAGRVHATLRASLNTATRSWGSGRTRCTTSPPSPAYAGANCAG